MREGVLRRSWAYEVCCVRCQIWQDVYPNQNSITAAARDLRSDGWSKRQPGWTCPACVEAIRTGAKP